MSRSTRSATATTGVHRASKSIRNYTFAYQRDDVSHKAGVSYLTIQPNDSDSPVTMTLQEAHSLYNFLTKSLAR